MAQWLLRNLCESTEMESGEPGICSQYLFVIINTPSLLWLVCYYLNCIDCDPQRFNDGLGAVWLLSKVEVRE